MTLGMSLDLSEPLWPSEYGPPDTVVKIQGNRGGKSDPCYNMNETGGHAE